MTPDPDEPLSAPDPQQLPLGVFEGEPLLPLEPELPAQTAEGFTYREPPVCGEWSYDDSELEETRFVARRIDGVSAPSMKATPIHPIRTVVDPKAMAARSAAARAASVKPEVDRVPSVDPPSRSLRPTVEALRLAFEQSPSDTIRATTYATALERNGDAAAAVSALERAADAGADAFAIACARASALGALLRYDDAAKALKQASKLKPDHPEVLVQTGVLACRRGRWKDALEPLQKGAAADPSHAQAFYYYGEALNHTDRLPEARDAYHRAAELDPENWRALKGIGIVLDRMGRSSEAGPWYRRARDAQRG